jgi:hypothetical protein
MLLVAWTPKLRPDERDSTRALCTCFLSAGDPFVAKQDGLLLCPGSKVSRRTRTNDGKAEQKRERAIVVKLGGRVFVVDRCLQILFY